MRRFAIVVKSLSARRRGGSAWRALAVALLAVSAWSGAALAGDPWEAWPELNAFVRLNQQTRLYFDLAYAWRGESRSEALDVAAYVDVSLKPILRPVLRQEDWARNKYLWARIGYDRVFKSEGGVGKPSEDRGVVSLHAKYELPWNIWLEGRARGDLRWISSDYSTRYRLRMEATREFTVFGHPVTPYVNAEWFYDTRYDGWARTLYQAGPEVTLDKHFRFEVYLARQVERLPAAAAANALGLVAKVYF